MKFLRITPALLLLTIAVLLSACSLSKDVLQMEETDEYEAYIAKWAPSEDAFVALQRLAKPALDAKDWNAAVAVFEQHRSRFPGMESRFASIIAVLKAESYDVELTNLGRNINSPGDDIKPSVTVDGQRMYFASDREGGMGKLDIYVSDKKDGVWQPAVNLGKRINTPDHETINGLSFDGTKILIYGGFPGHMGNGDNYYFEKTDRGWSSIMHFPPMVNSRYYDSDAFMTADGFAVLFTSDREGVVGNRVPKNTPYHGSFAGNTDIFVSVRRGTYWQPPINLGPTINTPYAERSPFLHPDGRTLYFASDGHPGLGKMDVFKSVRPNNSSWTEWSEPVNLGKDVNGSDDDWGYRITPDGKLAFFSTTTQKDGLGENDIYMITLPRGARPEAEVATIKGKITDEDGKPVDADVLVQRLSDGEVIARLQTDPQTGAFEGTIPKGEDVAVFAEREGYYPDAINLNLKNGSDGNGTLADGSLRNGSGNDGSGKNGSGNDGSGNDGSGNDGSGKNGSGNDGSGKNGSGNDGSGKNGSGNDGSGNDGSGKNGSGNDGSGNDGSGNDGSGKNGSGNDGSGKNGSGNDGSGNDGSGKNGSGNDGSGKNGSGNDGSGNDGSGKNGSGNDGSGKNGSGNDGSGKNGSGNDGSGKNGSGNDGSGNDGSGKNGSGNDGSGKNGSGNDGSGKNGSGNDGSGNDGSGKNGSGNDGSGNDGSGNDGSGGVLTFNFNLKSIESMKTRRDKWGDLLAQRVNNIFFDFAKWDLQPESAFELARLVRFLETNPELRIIVTAHTDDIGSDEYNVELSRKRAGSVVEFLVTNGISANRLESVGYGESRPEVPNDTEENRARNRRVEFRVDE